MLQGLRWIFRKLSLVKKIGMSQPQVARLENLVVQPTLASLRKYAAGLGFKITLSVVPV